MIQLDLNPEERQILIDVLDGYLSDLRMEIADTDRQDFREYLKTRKQVLIRVLEHLGQPAEPAAEHH